jgi:AcrR family transcriptional regulator
MPAAKRSPRPPRADNREKDLLDAAARLFAQRGYAATSMRDIGVAIDMLAGSVYYHFPSKEELLVAVYQAGVEQLEDASAEAMSRESDPWQRLEALCRAHLEVVLTDSDYARVLIRVHPDDIPSVADRLRELRSRQDERFRAAIDALPLRRGTDRGVLRLMLLGALNWSLTWFAPEGRRSPRALAHQYVTFIKETQHAPTTAQGHRHEDRV